MDWNIISASIFGLAFLITVMTFAIKVPNPSDFQFYVFRTVLALSSGGIASTIPGFLSVNMDFTGIIIRAGGALACFVLVYKINPGKLLPTVQAEVNTTIVGSEDNIFKRGAMDEKKEKVIVFLEDRPDSILDLIASSNDKGFHVEVFSTPHSLASYLHDHKNRIALIVVDIMLHGISNLESIGIEGVDTENGYLAGWAIIDHLLRPDGQADNFYDIPILILSSRWLSEEDKARLVAIRNRGGSPIEFIEKYAVNAGNKWKGIFTAIIEEKFKIAK